MARGKSYNTTVAYAPADLSTAMSARPQQTECTYITVNYTMLGDYTSSGNPDFFLSIPSSLTSLDPAWSTCTPALYGAWDPPKTLQHATALTDPADPPRPSPSAAPVGRLTPVYAPATTTTAIKSPATASATPSVAAEPGASRTSEHAKTNAAEPADPALVQSFYKSAALGSPSNNIHIVPSVPNGKPDFSDPSNTTPGVEGFSDAVVDDSEYAIPTRTAEKAPLFSTTQANGIVTNPDGNRNEFKIGDEIISVDEPATAFSGAAFSLAPSELSISSLELPFPAETDSRSAGLGGLVINASRSGQSPAKNGSNGSNAIVFADGAFKSSHFYSISVWARVTAVAAMVGLAL
ncbi:hypothetical protein IMSHALPRED_010383 [Imshaugia aleurites]|uniref:Uncharacterized protein n=1 Tax=Imshaugia aleurites TaxID=172621 RepID=A0A8H3G6X8_9LECA|nr:hypothetical protein IMSHALPRED_010383 [Imshaugia aleurites]